jgi:hypothetical protein
MPVGELYGLIQFGCMKTTIYPHACGEHACQLIEKTIHLKL